METTIIKKYQSFSKGLGTTGVIMGTLTFIFSMLPLLGMLALPLGLFALFLIAIGLGIAVKHQHEKSRLIALPSAVRFIPLNVPRTFTLKGRSFIITSLGTAISLWQNLYYGS